MFFNTKGHIIEQLCAEFDDQEDIAPTQPNITTNYTMNLLTTNHTLHDTKEVKSLHNTLKSNNNKIKNKNTKQSSPSQIEFGLKDRDEIEFSRHKS